MPPPTHRKQQLRTRLPRTTCRATSQLSSTSRNPCMRRMCTTCSMGKRLCTEGSPTVTSSTRMGPVCTIKDSTCIRGTCRNLASTRPSTRSPCTTWTTACCQQGTPNRSPCSTLTRGTLARIQWVTQSPHISALKLNPWAMLSSPSMLSNPSMLSSPACKTTGSSHRWSTKVGNCPKAKTPTSQSSKLRWATGTSARTSRASSTAMPLRGSPTTSHPKSCCFSWHSECVHVRASLSRCAPLHAQRIVMTMY
mmetsp:Transcript_59423/g.158140  ORF Transcript_59423/g.158140 Transcript_59423/m.158140 type:complete len:251 (-) Transcript_59423:14-766(-)